MNFFSKKYMWLTIAVVLLTGCKKDDVEESSVLVEGPRVQVNVGAKMAQIENTQKSYIDGNEVKWEVGDKILFNNTVQTIGNVNGTTGTFRADATLIQNPGNGNYHWFAVYPHYLAADPNHMLWTDNGGASYRQQLHINIPRTQYYQDVEESSGYPKNMSYMVAYTTTSNANEPISLRFMNLCAVLKIGLKAGPTNGHGAHLDHAEGNPQNRYVKKIVLRSVESASATSRAFWGEGKVTTTSQNSGGNNIWMATGNETNGALSPTSTSPEIRVVMKPDEATYIPNKKRKLVLDCTHKLNPETGGAGELNNDGKGVELDEVITTWFYIMVPINFTSGTYAGLEKMVLDVYDGNGNMMHKYLEGFSSSNPFVRKIYTTDFGQLQCQYAASSFIDADFSYGLKTFRFASGNLQYNLSSNEYRFAPNQYSVIGADNEKIRTAANSNTWIDLFSYASGRNTVAAETYNASAWNAYSSPLSGVGSIAGRNTSATAGSSNYPEYDWGNNFISGHPKNSFFTMFDWQFYPILNRFAENAENKYNLSLINGIRFSFALSKVDIGSGNYVYGLILFPDEFSLPQGFSYNSATINNGLNYKSYSSQNEGIKSSPAETVSLTTVSESAFFTCTKEQLEEMKCVFLPCAGIRSTDGYIATGSSTGTPYSTANNSSFSYKNISETDCINRVGYYYFANNSWNMYLFCPFSVTSRTSAPYRTYTYDDSKASIYINNYKDQTDKRYSPMYGGSVRLAIYNF